MKSEREAKQIQVVCNHLGKAFTEAGYPSVLTYNNEEETIISEGTIKGMVNVYASSVGTCVVDIFTQLLPSLKRAIY